MKKCILIAVLLFLTVLVRAENTGVVYLDRGDTVPENIHAGRTGLHVVFPCNKIRFDRDQEQWTQLLKALTDIYEDSTKTLEAVHMYGAASPEGPYANNVWLSVNRYRTVIRELEKNFPGIGSFIDVYNVPEDYERMLWVTRHDSVYTDLYTYVTDDDFITKKNLQGRPEMWKDLLDRYFPGLRAVNVLVYARNRRIRPVIVIPDIPLLNTDWTVPVPPEIIRPARRECCFSQPALRIKTNLVYDLAMTPNVALEFLPKTGHVTPEIHVLRAGWRNDGKFRTWIMRGWEAGFRYYFAGNARFTGWFAGFTAGLGVYDIQTSRTSGFLSKKYAYNNKGEITAGFVKRLGKSGWTMEAVVGIGAVYSRHDRYHAAEPWATPGQFYFDWHDRPEDFVKYNRKFTWIGPVSAGFSLSYDILRYKKRCATF